MKNLLKKTLDSSHLLVCMALIGFLLMMLFNVHWKLCNGQSVWEVENNLIGSKLKKIGIRRLAIV